MGLDMFAFVTAEDIPAVDFSEDIPAERLFYWRKHPNLHGWMERLYRSKGGTAGHFNVVPVRLDAADLDALENAIKERALPETCGFFFGTSDGSETEEDLHFVKKARDALAQNKRVYYTSWW
jgi:hypothetical protein